MAIVAETDNWDDSPWYKLIEEKAEAWNQFAFDIDVDIDGYFNAWGMEFSIVASFYDNEIQFNGIRSLKRAYLSDVLPIKNKIFEELVIWIDKGAMNSENSFRIRKRNLRNLIASNFSRYRKKSIERNFILEYNSDYCIGQIKNLHILGFNNLNKVELNKNEFLLCMNYLPMKLESFKKILELCEAIHKL